jgi:DNA-binding FadR family transcriptional regulator
MTRARLSRGARAAVFAPLDPLGRAEAVTRRLSDAIALGLLHDSEQLPSEAALAETLGVSTVTVREALTVLRQRGLVETRRGRAGGSFVRAPEDPAVAVLRSRVRELSLGDVRDLCDHYAAVSGTAARLAADRASPDDVERMENGTDQLATAQDAGSRRRAEGQFHVELAAAAQSARLTREEISLQTEVAPLLWIGYDDETTRRRVVEDHRQISTAITRGDGDAARAAAERHVQDGLRRLSSLHRSLVKG